VVLVGRNGLHNQLDVGRHAQDFGNDIGGAGQQAALEQHDVGGIALDRKVQILERISLGDDPEVVFEREYFANSDAVNSLGVGKNNANRSRLDLSVK